MTRLELIEAQTEMSCMTEVGKTWGKLKWLTQDKSERCTLVCAYEGGVTLVI